MKKQFVVKGLCAVALTLLFSACQKNGTTPALSATQLSFGVSADGAETSLASSAGNGLVTNAATGTASIKWTSGIANIAYFMLEAKKGKTSIQIKSKALTNVDLFAPIPANIAAIIDIGTYKEIEVKILLLKTTSANIPLTLKGIFTTLGGAHVPIEFDFNDDAFFKAKLKDVTVDGKTDIRAIVKLHLGKLLSTGAAVILDKATRVGGTIVISNTVNPLIYQAIKDKFADIGEGGDFEHHDKGERKK